MYNTRYQIRIKYGSDESSCKKNNTKVKKICVEDKKEESKIEKLIKKIKELEKRVKDIERKVKDKEKISNNDREEVIVSDESYESDDSDYDSDYDPEEDENF
jgi:succinate dehydrogenase/fumarate reductase flavoprotein subunit